MEREGKGEGRGRREGEGRRRGGGEKMRGRRGIIVGGMVIGLLMGCNNGGEDPQKVFLKSVVSLGNEFLGVFTSFGDMVGGILGFKATTKKSEIGNYFKTVKETVEGTKTALNKIVADMKSEGNPNAEATDGAVKKLVSEKLEKIIDGASDAMKGADGEGAIGSVADSGAAGVGSKADDASVKSLSEGIEKIVGVVLGKDKADVGDNKNPAQDSNGNAGNARVMTDNTDGNGALALFANKAIDTPDAGKVARDASKAVGAVSGIAILQAISEGESGNAAKLAKHNNTLSEGTPIAAAKATDATIAGGIALRAMAKGGKFSNKSSGAEGAKQQIKDAAVSAVTKALNELTIAIRKTIDEELKKVKEAMNINVNAAPVTTIEAKN